MGIETFIIEVRNETFMIEVRNEIYDWSQKLDLNLTAISDGHLGFAYNFWINMSINL